MRRKAFFICLTVSVAALLFLFLPGCGWFSDNPMFPKAKVSIVADVKVSSLSAALAGETDSESDSDSDSESGFSRNWGWTEFTFTPLNRVGVKITQCRLEYKKTDGTALASLTRTIEMSIDVIPPQTPMASVAGVETASVKWSVDLLPPDVEAYLRSNRIPGVIVSVTFYGVDYATHSVQYRGGDLAFSILEGLLDLTLEFFCSAADCPAGCSDSFRVGCYLKVDDASMVTKVVFSINGEPAGVDTTPPFISESVPVSLSDTVAAVAVVYDINGGVLTVTTKREEVQEICQPESD
ncbi:MAG: hypothetical protein H5U36_00540 [Candidatus Caldatribacterium sp.]|nr:hypothetical protein [Candidatus Caldatribacterium sp.]